MRMKCDTCSHNAISDERDVGTGYLSYCNKGHWDGDYDDENDEYDDYRDDCVNYELRRNKNGNIRD